MKNTIFLLSDRSSTRTEVDTIKKWWWWLGKYVVHYSNEKATQQETKAAAPKAGFSTNAWPHSRRQPRPPATTEHRHPHHLPPLPPTPLTTYLWSSVYHFPQTRESKKEHKLPSIVLHGWRNFQGVFSMEAEAKAVKESRNEAGENRNFLWIVMPVWCGLFCFVFTMYKDLILA